MVKTFITPKPGRKLMSSVMDSHTTIVHPVENFTLKATTEFASRSSDIFSSLSNLENKHQSWVSQNDIVEPFDDHKTDQEPVKKMPDVFKKPFLPPPRKRKLPSRSRRNMKKWIKYSLEDTPLSSDATNSAVAFQFLRELRAKKEKSEEETRSAEEKLIFCNPKKEKYPKLLDGDVSACTSRTGEIYCDRADFTTSKIKPMKERKDIRSNIKLGHLEDDFDDE